MLQIPHRATFTFYIIFQLNDKSHTHVNDNGRAHREARGIYEEQANFC